MLWQADFHRDPTGPTEHPPVAAFLSSVFLTMAGGVMVTAAAAELVVHEEALSAVLVAGDRLSPIGWLVLLAPLGLVLLIGGGIERLSLGAARGLFLLYAALVGLSLGAVLQAYAGANIAAAFIGAAAGFAALALYGLTTHRRLDGLGNFMAMALVGLVFAMLIALFTASPGFDALLAVGGVLIFAGLTAYDTQRLRRLHEEAAIPADRIAVIAALSLYLDLLNLCLSLLRLTGRRR